MKISNLMKLLGGALWLGMFLMAGCISSPPVVQTPGTEVVVDQPPPAPMVEMMSISPGPGYVWVPGAWSWRTQWVWDHGHWAHPPEPGAIWISPRFEKHGDKLIFIQGGWKY